MIKFLRLFALSLLCSSALTLAAPSADELLTAHTRQVLENAKLSGKGAGQFTASLLESTDWQHELWDSGPVFDELEAVRTLFALWQRDPKLATRPVDRQMATAMALEGPGRRWELDRALERYMFFRIKYAKGLLNSQYQDLTTFERRYLANGVQHEHLNGLKAMEYQNEEVCLPAERYTGACWYSPYLLHNPFGDSIHGPLYYRPFENSYDNAAEMVHKVGGVCGSLSNFGAAAAIANGVPAITMGEPGHCAYAVLTQPGNWSPAYSLSWQRGVHNHYIGGTWGWHVLNNQAYDNRQDASASGDLRRLAQYHATSGDPVTALATLQQARTRFPADWLNWQASLDLLQATNATNQAWQDLHQDVIKHLAPISSEIAFQILDQHIYDRVMPKGDSSVRQRRNILLTFHSAFNHWGTGQWDFSNALKRQLARLGADEAAADEFMTAVFTEHAAENLFSPIVLEYQLQQIGDDEPRLQRYIAGLSRALSTGGDTNAYRKVVETMAAKVLPDAARRGDRATFQFVGKLSAKYYQPCDITPEPFPGILLSSGGAFSITKPGNRWDSPSQHWGVIEPHGGTFHTDHTPATATVQLGNFGRLTGVVIVTRNSHFYRMGDAKLQISTDGERWTDVHTFTKHQRVYRIDLSDRNLDAGYVRVLQPNHGSIHFNKFHVYGHKQN